MRTFTCKQYLLYAPRGKADKSGKKSETNAKIKRTNWKIKRKKVKKRQTHTATLFVASLFALPFAFYLALFLL